VRARAMTLQSYIIRGGIEGRERLRLVSRIMRPTTLALFERAGVRDGRSASMPDAAAATCLWSWRGWLGRAAVWSASISTP
jgi:hypothetical protein